MWVYRCAEEFSLVTLDELIRGYITTVLLQRAAEDRWLRSEGADLAVHVVFSFDQLPTVHLAGVGLTGDDVSLCFVQDLDGYADGHASTVLRKNRFRRVYRFVLHELIKLGNLSNGGQTKELLV